MYSAVWGYRATEQPHRVSFSCIKNRIQESGGALDNSTYWVYIHNTRIEIFMRNKPKIADHSSLQISIALNRSKKFVTPISSLEPLELLASYIKTRKMLFCDFLDVHITRAHSKLIKLFTEFHTSLQTSTELLETCKAISSLFIALNEVNAFNFGNNITVRKFLYDLSIYLTKLEILPRPIDFRYADETLYELMNLELALEFKRILTTTTRPMFDSDFEDWPTLPDASIKIGAFRYLTYDDNFLVTLNGGLIEVEAAGITLERSLKKRGNPNDFTINRSATDGYLFNNDKPISTLDGLTFGDEVPLMCLDVDHLTGMVMNAKFEDLLHKLDMKKLSILDIPELDGFKSLIDDRIRSRILRLRGYINIVKRRFFKDKKPVNGMAKLFLSMGGIGSGKSSLEKYISEATRGNHVIASIDKARACSKLFDFYIKCNHHADDYKSLKLFSHCLVEEITKEVRQGNYHYFRDASGIPFDKNNASSITSFKDLGYETNIYSTSAPLFVEKDRKDLDKPAHIRILKRYRKKNRAVPWQVVVEKHVEHPGAFLDSIKHPSLDNLAIYDTGGKKGESKLLAYMKEVSQTDIVKLHRMREISKGSLLNKLILLGVIDEADIPREFALKRLDFFECTRMAENRLRILVIFDIVKFIDLMQKGSLYENASGYDELIFNSNAIHIPSVDYPYDKRHNEFPWRLRNQIITNDGYLL